MPKGRPDKGYALTPQREKVLRLLAQAGGSLDDEAGMVVSKLREKTGHESTQALSMVIKQLETSGLVKRDVAGRRTYRIELIPDALTPEDRRVIGMNGRSDVASTVTPTERLRQPDIEIDEPVDVTDGLDYRRLADELLKSASAVLARKAGDPQLKLKIAELEARVSDERARADRLETQLLDRGEEVLTLKEQLRIAEHNLAAVQKQREKQKAERGSDKVAEKLTPRERKELEDLKRLMQERPGS